MKINRNMLLMVLAGVIVVLVAVAAFLLIRGFSQFSAQETTLRRSVHSLRHFYSEDPFASDENVERESRNADLLVDWYQRLTARLKEGEVAPERRSPSTFMRMFNEQANAWRERARKGGTICPDNFAFGFGRYQATGALPAPDDVPRLVQQLEIIGELSDVLFEHRVKEIKAIHREEFDAAGGDTAAPAPAARAVRNVRRSSGRHGAAVRAAGPTSEPDAGVLKGDDLYARLHFEIDFSAREKALLQIINSLAAHPMFVVVTRLEFEKEEADILKATLPGATGEGEDRNVVAEPVEIPSRHERMVSGEELEASLAVRMELDVYRFAGAGK